MATAPVQQSLTHLDTIEAAVRAGCAAGAPDRRVCAFVEAPARVRARLGCDQVLQVKRLNLADGEPFAVVTVWCPAELGEHLSRRDVESKPFYELLGLELRGATQTIGAAAADETDAELLEIPLDSPVLRCERVTTTVEGTPVLMSAHLPAHRTTEFTVELPLAEPSIVPSEQPRLVE
ncbi:MAG: UTRA domain-containing protein [Ilumatobacteraceae bacterium]